MAFNIKNPPEFTTDIPQWGRETIVDGQELSVVPEMLLNNDVYLKASVERLSGKLLKDITIEKSAWISLTYAIADPVIVPDSRVEIIYAFDSIPIAQKANIRGRTEAGKLILVAAKLPTADIVVEEIHIVNRE